MLLQRLKFLSRGLGRWLIENVCCICSETLVDSQHQDKKTDQTANACRLLFSTCTYTHLLTPMNTYVSIYYTQSERETEQDI